MSEIVDLYDLAGTVVGQAPRSRVRAQNLRHAATGLLVRNGRGDIFVHRRTDTKDVYPGMYDVAAGGVITAGEDPDAAAAREAEEELGVHGVPLHRLGVAHSVEAWTPAGELAGGLYGVGLGGLFAGESMFHDPVLGRDASKVALLGLASVLDDGVEGRLLDVQWVTDHLASLGAVEVDRVDYLRLAEEALSLPPPPWPPAGTRLRVSAWVARPA